MFLRVGVRASGALVPSPLVGEGGSPRFDRGEPGEGTFASTPASPSPASPPSLRFGGSSPSPARGEGDGVLGEAGAPPRPRRPPESPPLAAPYPPPPNC